MVERSVLVEAGVVGEVAEGVLAFWDGE